MKLPAIFASIFLSLLICSLQAQAQGANVFTVTSDGKDANIVLVPTDFGKDIILLAESTSPKVARVTITLGGPSGIIGTLFTRQVPIETNISSLDVNSGWELTDVKFPNAGLQSQIIVGQPPSGSGGSSGTACPSWLSESTIQQFLNLYRAAPQYGPNFTREQLCALLANSQSANPGGGTSSPPEANHGNIVPATGLIFRDACSDKVKTVAMLRITMSGQPLSVYNGANYVSASIKLAWDKTMSGRNPFTIKAAEGRERGGYLYISPALGTGMYSQKYGQPNSDTVYVSSAKDGVINKTTKFKVRWLYGGRRVLNISLITKILNNKRKKLTFQTVSASKDRSYNNCATDMKRRQCGDKYDKIMNINCK